MNTGGMTPACTMRSTAWATMALSMAAPTAVEVGAANLKNPMAAKEIIEELPRLMEELGIERLSDIIGGAH